MSRAYLIKKGLFTKYQKVGSVFLYEKTQKIYIKNSGQFNLKHIGKAIKSTGFVGMLRKKSNHNSKAMNQLKTYRPFTFFEKIKILTGCPNLGHTTLCIYLA